MVVDRHVEQVFRLALTVQEADQPQLTGLQVHLKERVLVGRGHAEHQLAVVAQVTVAGAHLDQDAAQRQRLVDAYLEREVDEHGGS